MRRCGFTDSDRTCEESCRYWNTCSRRDSVWSTPEKENEQNVGCNSKASANATRDRCN